MMRRFNLHRDHDVSGISGTGVVARGVEFPDGVVCLRWSGERPSTVVWNSLSDAMYVHGHGGKTRVVWIDYYTQGPTPEAVGDIRGPGNDPLQLTLWEEEAN